MKPAVFASARAADSLFLSKEEFGIQKKESNHLWHNCWSLSEMVGDESKSSLFPWVLLGGIDSEVLAMFVVNLFHSWFKNTEKGTIQKTLHNTTGTYSIKIDENVLEHLPELEEKVLGKKHK